MKIAFLAPIKRPLTPDTTVSRLRIMADLITGLKMRGHRVAVFGTADSHFPGVEIVGVVPKGLNFLPAAENPFYRHTAYLCMVIAEFVKQQEQFDLVHNHMYPEFLPLLASTAIKIPMVTTVHAQMTDELRRALKKFPQAKLITISKAARRIAGFNMQVVYNGIDTALFVPDETKKRDYLLFVGRISKAKDKKGNFLDPKGAGNAIKVAQITGEKLKIVGNVEDRKFYDQLIAPYLNEKITFVQELAKEQKLTREEMVSLYQGAKALLNPINWEEPFGLVMVEAMSCGTPVIAFNRGSVPELVVDGETGYIVSSTLKQNKFATGQELKVKNTGFRVQNSKLVVRKTGIEGLCQAVERIYGMTEKKYRAMRRAARQRVEKHFTIEKMVERYEETYRKVLEIYY